MNSVPHLKHTGASTTWRMLTVGQWMAAL